MKKTCIYLAMSAALSFGPAALAANLTQPQLSEFAQHTDLHFGTISNFAEGNNSLKAHLVLDNHSSVALPAGESSWRIYFHSIRQITALESAGLRLTHINGDLNELAPTKAFAGLPVGGKLEFVFGSGDWIVSYTDFMPRAFIAQPGATPVTFANTDTEDLHKFVEPFVKPEQQLRYGGAAKSDLYPIATAASRYQANLAVNQEKVDAAAVAHRIIPAPKDMKLRKGEVTLDSSWQIRYAGRLTQEVKYLQAQLKQAGLELTAEPDTTPGGKVIEIRVGGADTKAFSKAEVSNSPESYQLDVNDGKILITGADNAGSFYGIQSLLALLPAQKAASYALPKASISDSPRFTWRGMHYDVGRNFHNKAVTLRLIEQMARYKLNKLHLHLSEDEGWRLEIPGLPELTEIGGARCFDLSEQTCLLTQLGTGPLKSGSGNGFYTRADFIEILKFADARHIEVIPEIDMPGHARAAIKSMQVRYNRLNAAGQKEAAQQYLLSDPADKSVYMTVQNYTDDAVNVCLPSTYAFADKVIYEIQQMYRTAGIKMATFHMGGDETGKGAWTESPACKALFAKGEKAVAGVADLKPYFVSKIADITSARGLSLVGWEDGLMYDPVSPFNRKQFSNEKVIGQAWDNIWEWGVADRAYRLANAGYQVVLASGTHLYFDHPYEPNPEERGYYWATRYTDTAKVFGFMPDNYYANAEKTQAGVPITNLEALVGREMPKLEKPENILGIQGEVWTETIRTGEQMEQMVYPRLIALGERAWSKGNWEADKPNVQARTQAWALFANRLTQQELPKLIAGGVGFHLPPPGAIVENGQLKVNVAYPGLAIEYSEDDGASWKPFGTGVAVAGKQILLRSKIGEMVSRPTRL